MGDREDPLLAQTQEVEALQAIYGDDFTERPGVWNRPAFAIRVQPVGLEDGVVAHVTLTVKVGREGGCTDDRPHRSTPVV